MRRPPCSLSDVPRLLLDLYGDDLVGARGVVHVAAVWQGADGELVTLRVTEAFPDSPTDRFVLGVSRARADAIVTTGRILRREPTVTHGLPGPDETVRALQGWRHEVLGRLGPPISLVLTRGGDRIDPGHPLLQGSSPTVLFTGLDARLPAGLDRSVTVVRHPAPSLCAAIGHLQGLPGVETISIEAGPATAQELYRPGSSVDELMLSVWRAPELPHALRGPDFIPVRTLEKVVGPLGRGYTVDEPSGPWTFFRARPDRGMMETS